MRFSVRVHVTLKPTVNDPQGNAVLGGLHSLGFDNVQSVRVGKYLTLTVDSADEHQARADVSAMCEKLLANTVTEVYEAEVFPAG